MKKNIELSVVFMAGALLGMTPLAAAQPDFEELWKQRGPFLETARKFFKWDEPAEPAKIIGPIYFVGTKGLGVFLITTSEGLIVLNTGMPGSGPMIEASIRKLGFKPQEIKILLAGHAHIDHVGGHAYLKKMSGAKVAMMREEKDLFESGGKLDFHYGKYKDFEFEPTNVDQVFKDGDVIKLGDIAITALLTAGHTQGATTFVTSVVDNGKTYAVLFPSSASVNPGYRLVNDPSYPGIADDFRRTFRILEAFEPGVWLHPHNESYAFDAKLTRSATVGAAAWVDPDGYRRLIASQREKFEATIDREMRAQGEGK